MTQSRAAAVIAHRDGKRGGRITSRAEVAEVKGIGKKTFQQAVGFLRVSVSATAGGAAADDGTKGGSGTKGVSKKGNKATELATVLDATAIHPESYKVAKELLAWLGLSAGDIGTPAMLAAVTGRFGADTVAAVQAVEASSLGVCTPSSGAGAADASDARAGDAGAGAAADVRLVGSDDPLRLKATTAAVGGAVAAAGPGVLLLLLTEFVRGQRFDPRQGSAPPLFRYGARF
jgi:hypothetical protein